MESRTSSNKSLSKPFVYNLYKTYEAAYSDASIQHAKTLAVVKVQQVANISRATVYKILKEAREYGEFSSPAIRRKRVRGAHRIKDIKEKIITLSERNNAFVPFRRIYAEVTRDGIFKGSKGLLRTLMREMGFYYAKCDDRWQLILSDKNLPDVPINFDQTHLGYLSDLNMMEVKHSPAAQLEFRSVLPDEEEDANLDTLFDGEVKKNLSSSNDKQNTKAPTLNGLIKHTKVDNTENVEEVTAEVDLYMKLELDQGSAPDEKASKSANTAKVRDTGRDLDTLLSKINDLVEDCEVVKPNGNYADKAVEIVEIDDELDDDDDDVGVTDNHRECEANANEEKVNAEVKSDGTNSSTPAEGVRSIEEPSSANDTIVDSDDIVCLDSPLSTAGKDNQTEVNSPQKENDSAEEMTPSESESEQKVKAATKSTDEPIVSEEVKQSDNDEIFLIEDDDDDNEENVEKKSEESETAHPVVEEQPKPVTADRKASTELKEIDSPIKEEQKTEASTDIPPPANDADNAAEVYDIVCLDDSLEDDTKKPDEVEIPQEIETSESTKLATEPTTEKTVDKSDEKSTECLESHSIEQNGDVPVEPAPETKTVSTDTEITTDKTESSSSSVAPPDDDIVILDDDDEVITAAVSPEKPPSPELLTKEESPSNSAGDATLTAQVDEKSTESSEDKLLSSLPSTFLPDNSDNARDGGEENEEVTEEVASKSKTPTPSPENTQSNSSSNLLKASEDQEEPVEQPPIKRMRLSVEETDSRHSTVSQEDTKSNNADDVEPAVVPSREFKDDESNKSLKRTHSSESLSSESKKTKTDIEPECKPESLEDEKKADVKPLDLYPPPKLDMPGIDLSLDFLKRFKKSLHKMTKMDLEELVLQKIVEAVVHKSEFSEMRELIEKQEKIIAGHRTKITELNKQFRDLEMVHNRVLKDLETKNSQFIMPVKITRAVGLQVCFPNKRVDQPSVPPPSSQPAPAPPVSGPRNSSNANTATTENRSSYSNPSPGSSNAITSLSNKITATIISSLQQQSNAQRRGCVQKLTPMRPDTPRNSPLNRATAVSSAASTPSTSPNPAKDGPPKILNRMVAQKKPVTSPSVNNLLPMAPQPAPVSTPPSVATKKICLPTRYNDSVACKSKPKYSPNTSQPKTFQPEQQNGTAPSHSAAPEAAVPSTQTPQNQTSNTSSATNPPLKSVIDLTDEDDVVPPSAVNSPRTPMPAQAVLAPISSPTVSATAAQQTPVNSVAATVNRSKTYTIAQQQLQQLQKPNPPKQTPQRIPVTIAPKPNGVAIAVRQVPPNQNRYRHPAPLPNQPVQTSNPAWKLPPARPTIRISNLESGIVISWTIEDTSKDKYAESTSYQIYAYQETSGPPLVESWRHVGDVKAMLLPMAVTLTQFQEGQRYYFAVRAVDAYNRCGPFSFAKTWS